MEDMPVNTATIAVIQIATLVILAAVLIYLFNRAFGEDTVTGVRSLAAIALPMLVLVLLFFLGEETLEPLRRMPIGLAIVVAAAIGFLGALLVHRVPEGKPLPELFVSTLFTWIGATWLLWPREDDRSFVYSASGLIGAATYLVFFGRSK